MKPLVLDLIFEEVERNLVVDDSWIEVNLEKNVVSNGIYLYINTGNNVGSLLVWTSGALEIQILSNNAELLNCETYHIKELHELQHFTALFLEKLGLGDKSRGRDL